MKRCLCTLFLLGLLFLPPSGQTADAPAKAPAPATPALPDLKEFRTVETALTTRISRAAPTPPVAQPGYLGVTLDATVKDRAVVSEVEPGSPAALAGLRAGDVLREVSGTPLTSPGQLRQLLHGNTPDADVQIILARKGIGLGVHVTLGAISRPMIAVPRAVLGVLVGDSNDKGVHIDRVTPGMPAEKAGLKAGDVVLKVDGEAVSGTAGLTPALEKKKPGDTVTLVVKRDDKEKEIKATLTAETRDRGGRPAGWDTREARLFKKPVYRLAVVAVEYPDVKHNAKVTAKDWEKALFSRGVYTGKSVTGDPVYGSLNDYYLEQSCGQMRVEGKVFEFVQVNRKRAEYGSDANRFALLTEAVDKLLARDGKEALKDFDGIFFLYAGGRTQSGRGGLYWPHRSSFNHNGKRWSYFICPEGGEKMASISVVAHEFGHMLGLPDLYARAEAPGVEGLGIWCTMSTGHGRDGKPLHLSAWCKEQLGWLSPAVIDPTVKQKLILAPVVNSTKECYKVLLRPDGSEYLLLENRVKKQFDRDLPGEGLLVWRVVGSRPQLEVSHGSIGPNSVQRFLGSVPYPSPANNAFTPDTIPSSKSADPNALPVHITNIQKLPDGRVTFYVGYEFF